MRFPTTKLLSLLAGAALMVLGDTDDADQLEGLAQLTEGMGDIAAQCITAAFECIEDEDEDVDIEVAQLMSLAMPGANRSNAPPEDELLDLFICAYELVVNSNLRKYQLCLAALEDVPAGSFFEACLEEVKDCADNDEEDDILACTYYHAVDDANASCVEEVISFLPDDFVQDQCTPIATCRERVKRTGWGGLGRSYVLNCEDGASWEEQEEEQCPACECEVCQTCPDCPTCEVCPAPEPCPSPSPAPAPAPCPAGGDGAVATSGPCGWPVGLRKGSIVSTSEVATSCACKQTCETAAQSNNNIIGWSFVLRDGKDLGTCTCQSGRRPYLVKVNANNGKTEYAGFTNYNPYQ